MTHIVKYLETVLGEVIRGYYELNNPIRVLAFDDVPIEDTVTYVTCGLSEKIKR